MDLSNLQSVLMKNPDKAMKLFDMISNMAAEHPQSQIAKDWDQIIQTVGVDDILNAYANQEALSKGKTGYANQEASSEEKAGYSGWKRYFKQMYGDYAIPTGFAVNKVILPVAGGLAEATGNSLGAYNSILGTALGAMANNIQKIVIMTPQDTMMQQECDFLLRLQRKLVEEQLLRLLVILLVIQHVLLALNLRQEMTRPVKLHL